MPPRPRRRRRLVLAGAALSTLALGSACCAPGGPGVPPGDILVIAHRGASADAPENTLAAVREAVRQTAHAIEVDLHQTRDGAVVALHDADVGRTTDGRGRVGDMTLAEVRALDAGSWFAPEHAGERVPTLAEVLAATPHDVLLVLEVKDGGCVYPGIEERVVAAVRAAGRPRGATVLKSFDPDVLETFAALAPELPRLYVVVARVPWLGLAIDRRPRLTDPLERDVTWLQVHAAFVTGRLVRRAHERGYRIVAWDAQSECRMRRMIELGVDAIETDHPARLRALLEAAAGPG
ncbi:MAG: glycerophosphodiester phosphodiesterase [Planctomycetes bacterium]|nr:glycerophosphodiester phosphodiesterase [Planctomycetota bacterium]